MKGRGAVLAALIVIGLTVFAVLGLGNVQQASGHNQPPSCKLDNGVKHVVFTIFDNVHFLRDNPNVPSDLEQMPHLLNFIRDNGTLITNDHTVLISHTGERDPHRPDRHVPGPARAGRLELLPLLPGRRSTALVVVVQVLDRPDGRRQHAARPTRTTTWSTGTAAARRTRRRRGFRTRSAGCDFGATALANVVLENTGTGPAGDMTKVSARARPSGTRRWPRTPLPRNRRAELAQTDFVGLGDPLRQGLEEHLQRQPEREARRCYPTSPAATPGSRACSGRSTSTRRSARSRRRTARPRP